MLGTLFRRRRILMIAANFTAILCMVVSLGVLVGACSGPGNKPPVASSTVTATAPGGSLTASTLTSVTIFLQYEEPNSQ
jgi:hypothetical protein